MSETHQDNEDPFQLKWARINEAKEKIDEVYSKFGKLSSELHKIMSDSVKGLPEGTMEEVLDRLRKHNTACVAKRQYRGRLAGQFLHTINNRHGGHFE